MIEHKAPQAHQTTQSKRLYGDNHEKNRPLVAPFARALSLLSAFDVEQRWLGNLELSKRTGLPSSTVTRMAQSLVSLGYLKYEEKSRKFRLTPAVLALGYGIFKPPPAKQVDRERMSSFTRQHKVNLIVCLRDKLDLIVIDSYRTSAFPESLQLGVGSRIELSKPVAGWALMASLPDPERSYLSESLDRKTQHNWRRLNRKFNDALQKVHQHGFCTSPIEFNQPIPMVAAPIKVDGDIPLAVACMAPLSKMPSSRLEYELGPALVSMAREIEKMGAANGS